MDAPVIVDVEWLHRHLGEEGLVVLDASVGTERASERRIPGARRFDIDGDMSDRSSPFPHTLPSREVFQQNVRALGISDDTRVVVYDAAGIFSAPRARWMLTTAGHTRVSVLDGGLPAWIAAGHPTRPWEDDGPLAPGTFTARPFDPHVVDRAELTTLLKDPDTVVLDARSAGRFDGIDPEPRPGMPSGHMPGAVNLPFTVLLRDGRFVDADDMTAAIDSHVPAGRDIVVSCGSGVTACVLALAAEVAGRHSRLYDGSWSEWATTEPDSIETTEPR